MKTIVTANLPFRRIAHPQFGRLINLLRSNIIVPSPNTLRRTIHKYAHTIHLQLKDLIPRNMQVHLATDTWMSPNGLAFAGTTVHFLHDN